MCQLNVEDAVRLIANSLMTGMMLMALPGWAADPVVTHVTAGQVVSTRTVRITYDLSASSPSTVSVLVSDNDSRMFTIIPEALSGAVGDSISAGISNEIIWNTAVDIPNVSGSDFKVRVIASSGGLGVPPNGHTMVSIPAGAFNMGHPGGSGDLVPVHSVTTSVYQIDKYEVTSQQYANFLNNALGQGMCTVVASVVKGIPDGKDWYETSGRVKYSAEGSPKFTVENGTNNPTIDFEQHPITYVTWYGAAAYCNWLSLLAGLQPCFIDSLTRCDFTRNGYRLPTEAEWERAARGEHDGWNYPWGATIDGTRANYAASGDAYENYGTTPIGYYSAYGAYSLYDMSGNVWEWVYDWYDAAWYSNAGATSNNPTGPLTGACRVLRGGAWLNVAGDLFCACRNGGGTPASRGSGIGFRCAKGAF